MAKVFVKPRRARPFWFGHPWVFSGAIGRTKGQIRNGGVVQVCDDGGRIIGEGFWNEDSQIRVRLATLVSEGALDADLLLGRLDDAIRLRTEVLRLQDCSNAYRLVHSESDGLPGLIVDRVGDHLVLQVGCLGLTAFLEPLLDRLQERLAPLGIVERESTVAREEEGLEREGGVLRGSAPAGVVEVIENGVRYLCDPMEGQKTGWFADQRDNRRALASLTRGQDVLDAFSYVGGFGIAMAVAGARSVRSVDSSAPSLELLERGAALNGVADRVCADKGNVLRVLDHDAKEGRRYDVVVLDPPKLVRKRSALERGLALYREINLKGLRVLRPGGLLITCSCSQHVRPEHFEEMLGDVAHEAGVRLQEIYRGGQSADHPVIFPVEESRYLDCRAFRVPAWGSEPDSAAGSGKPSPA